MNCGVFLCSYRENAIFPKCHYEKLLNTEDCWDHMWKLYLFSEFKVGILIFFLILWLKADFNLKNLNSHFREKKS